MNSRDTGVKDRGQRRSSGGRRLRSWRWLSGRTREKLACSITAGERKHARERKTIQKEV
jgi:hypothetical protein